MNKTFLKVLGISLAVIFAVFLAACPEEQDNNDNNNNGNGNGNGENFEIAGTYNFTYTNVVHTWVFNTDKTFKINWVRQSERNYTGTYSVSGNEITLQLDAVMGVSSPSEKFTASRSGKEVTLTLKGGAATSTTFAIFSMAATSLTLTEAEGSSGGIWTPDGYSPIQLTENQWTDGNISTSGGQQWFTFTATASMQYIHVAFGTLTNLYVQIYDSNGSTVGSSSNLYSSTRYASKSLTSDQNYYIKVWPYSGNGTYQIAFNTSSTPPAGTWTPEGYNPIQLTEHRWTDGNISTSGGQQWFTFTATASTQYIHVAFGTLTNLYVQIYDSNGNTVGSDTNMYSSTRYTSRSLASGQKYYIKVWPYSGNGTYQIAFNTTSSTPPAGTWPPDGYPVQLTEDQWANGNINSNTSENWFTFIATASTQYILHAYFGTNNSTQGQDRFDPLSVFVNVYDSNGYEVRGTSLGGLNSYDYTSSTWLTPGQNYYIKVSYFRGTGSYKIAFNTSNYYSGILGSGTSGDFDYIYDSTVTITGYNGSGGAVNIPSIIDGKTVVSIGKSVFFDTQAWTGKGLTSVTIPNSVTSIGERAFRGNQLTSVTIPNSVTFIGSQAFDGNPLISITIGANVKGVMGGTFPYSFDSYYYTSQLAGTYTRPNTSSSTWTRQ
jgi:hypothetical protein